MKNVVVHLIRHMKTGKAERDQDRQPNELGLQQMEQLATAIEEEGTKFDIMFYSPVARAELLAKRIATPNTIMVPVETLYEPSPESPDPNEQLDAALMAKANVLFGYDLKAWFSNHLVVDLICRRMKAAKAVIEETVEEKDGFVVGVVSHYVYLHELAGQLAAADNLFPFRKTHLAECDRFVLEFPGRKVETEEHVPLGQKYQ